MERNVEAEHFGGVEIDDELELRGLLDRQVAGPLTFEDPRGVGTDLAITIGNAGAVPHQPAGGSEFALEVDGRHRVTYRQRGDLFAAADEERIGQDDQRADPELGQACEGRFDVAFGAGLDDLYLQSERAGSRLRPLPGWLAKTTCRRTSSAASAGNRSL